MISNLRMVVTANRCIPHTSHQTWRGDVGRKRRITSAEGRVTVVPL